ncbi:hypothetical protein T440DRAFT_417405 [Plenodomus tracheiphilus IPT5]|uniref:Macro domain-containing protein n=1 Tax=Plenodomus tracheiphilus IPT5 TaxID=1408161 RepID=A0A6A7BJX4_9PLEO|nr:hypothetical protein T440DRAFT_417405 [Plenodomus tracheiphilus IPT5]
MSELRLATAANIQAFHSLLHALDISEGKWTASIDHEALEDEAGRFRVWSGNLGALQKGHSSLDYRLRDSPLLSSNALRFLQELEGNLKEAFAIVSGDRLPYEQQPKSREDDEDENDEDDGFFSDDEDESGGEEERDGPRTELNMRFSEVVDIIDNLYKLSVRIRTPTMRLRSLKAASYNPKDPDTGVDIMSAYAVYDDLHIKELLATLRQPFDSEGSAAGNFLAARLSAAITLRRRQFKYWKRHRDKLGAATSSDDQPALMGPFTRALGTVLKNEDLPDNAEIPTVILLQEAPSQKTGKTLLSGTEATHHHHSLDDIVDTKSVTSYAVTVKDIQGRGVDLPPPPQAATGNKDFECPYCYIICPARYGHGRAWRTHILQDLQPYCCTYAECDRAEQLFRSRREWAEHEASHRKVWRCPEHPTNAVYNSESGLESHLRREHLNSFPEGQLPTIVKVGETTTIDVRAVCPVCSAPADTDGLGDFQSHIANHLERIATFALPSGVEGESDGASGVASRGWSGSTGSRSITNSTTHSEDSMHNSSISRELDGDNTQIAKSLDQNMGLESARTFLSAESLQQIPDTSHSRVDITLTQLNLADEPEEPLSSDNQSQEQQLDVDRLDEDQIQETPAELEEHLEQREAFRVHLLSMPGATMVRFYKRYGSWTGRAMFTHSAAAAEAMKLFDKEQFPKIRLQQCSKSPEKLKFVSSTLYNGKKPLPTRQYTTNTQESPEARSVSSGSISYEDEEQISRKQPVIGISEIPTLRSLYRSRRLLQRDQSYAPNDAYNQVISFCYYDLTRLEVDAIVNSASSVMLPTRAETTLNGAVYRAAGPGLREETKLKSKLKAGQTELSHGHNLPSTWIIHAARPRYARSKGMGQFNALTECYRSALKMANNYEFKTIAFPCIGTGSGFPPRIAARIALQEVREYLDSHLSHLFQRVVFCINSAIDEKAYLDFFPVFFPPTHGDLDSGRESDFSANRAALAAQILETRGQVQKVNEELSTDFSLLIPDFDDKILRKFSAIDASLASIRGFLLGPKHINRSLADVNLVCSIMQMVCSRTMETMDVAKDTKDAWENNKKYWDVYNQYMTNTHGTNLVDFLTICQDFVQHLDDLVTRDSTESEAMASRRAALESYGARQKGYDGAGIREHLDEELYAREVRQKASVQSRNTVKLQQIPSLAKLYELGELGTRPTLARPSAIFNHSVCLAREDITMLEVDIMVNSTDVSFMGMGTLDRSVFKKGGPELRDQVRFFGKCEEGDVKMTPGYMLPAKHILHVVPPEQYGKNTKDLLRGIYREILHTAMLMRATSVALPSIGTGMLNYPRRDCASLAMEEVKRFLESAEPTSSVEKIIFVVYSSNDEFIYKNLLPVYFPPTEHVAEASSTAPAELDGESTTVEPKGPPRRTLFGSVGEALRNVRSGKQPEISRDVNSYEEHYLISFDSHAEDCPTCKDIDYLYSQGLSLCSRGYSQAKLLLSYMIMTEDQSVYTKPDRNGQYVKLMVPPDLYPLSLKLLHTEEKSVRDKARKTPFVTPSKNYAKVFKEQNQAALGSSSSTLDTVQKVETVRVALWSDAAAKWYSIHFGGCSVHITNGQVDIRRLDVPEDRQVSFLSLQLSPTMAVSRHENTGLILSGVTEVNFAQKPGDDQRHDRILFLNGTPEDSEKLMKRLQYGIVNFDYPKKDTTSSTQKENSQQVTAIAGPSSLSNPNPTQADNQDDAELADLTELVSKEQRGGTFGRLQNRIKKLMGATSSMSSRSGATSRRWSSMAPETGSEPDAPTSGLSTATNNPHEKTSVPLTDRATQEELTPLAKKVLAQMTVDLKTRPGSYIGQVITDIVATSGQSPIEISKAVVELATKGFIHNTIDKDTWVVSHPPADLPALPRQQTRGPSSEVPRDGDEIRPDTKSLAARAFSYLDKVSSPQATVTAAEQDSATETPPGISVREPASFADTPPSPTLPSNEPSTGNQAGRVSMVPDFAIETFPSRSGAQWTRIPKPLVNSRVLNDAEEDFDETEDNIIIPRVLRRGELESWTEQTNALTHDKTLQPTNDTDTETQPSKPPTNPETIQYDASFIQSLQTALPTTNPTTVPTANETVEMAELPSSTAAGKSKTRTMSGEKETSSWRTGRGEKDRRQAKLDRVLVGDMAEDELRYFEEGDGDGEVEGWRKGRK